MMTNYHMHTKELIVGAVLGGLLGSAAALLAAPKSGNKFRRDINDTYSSLSKRAQNLAKRGKCLTRRCGWNHKANSVVDEVGQTIRHWLSGEEEDNGTTRDLIIGGLAGGILGAVAGLLLAPKSGEDLRQDIMDSYGDASDRAQEFAKRGKHFARKAGYRADKWLNRAKHMAGDLAENTREEEWIEKVKDLVGNDRINNFLDWATLGFRTWQSIKSKH